MAAAAPMLATGIRELGAGNVAAHSSLHILLVDDERLSRVVVGNLLRKCNYQVTMASGGHEAKEILEHAAPGTFHLILTDVVMPEVDGIELLRYVRSHHVWHNLPVVMMSANEHNETVFECIRGGAEDYLLKPITKKELQLMWQHVWRRTAVAAQNNLQLSGPHALHAAMGGMAQPNVLPVHATAPAVAATLPVQQTQRNGGSKREQTTMLQPPRAVMPRTRGNNDDDGSNEDDVVEPKNSVPAGALQFAAVLQLLRQTGGSCPPGHALRPSNLAIAPVGFASWIQPDGSGMDDVVDSMYVSVDDMHSSQHGGDGMNTTAAMAFALGMLLYDLTWARHFPTKADRLRLLLQLRNDNVVDLQFARLHSRLSALACSLTHPDAARRPSFSQLVSHESLVPYFSVLRSQRNPKQLQEDYVQNEVLLDFLLQAKKACLEHIAQASSELQVLTDDSQQVGSVINLLHSAVKRSAADAAVCPVPQHDSPSFDVQEAFRPYRTRPRSHPISYKRTILAGEDAHQSDEQRGKRQRSESEQWSASHNRTAHAEGSPNTGVSPASQPFVTLVPAQIDAAARSSVAPACHAICAQSTRDIAAAVPASASSANMPASSAIVNTPRDAHSRDTQERDTHESACAASAATPQHMPAAQPPNKSGADARCLAGACNAVTSNASGAALVAQNDGLLVPAGQAVNTDLEAADIVKRRWGRVQQHMSTVMASFQHCRGRNAAAGLLDASHPVTQPPRHQSSISDAAYIKDMSQSGAMHLVAPHLAEFAQDLATFGQFHQLKLRACVPVGDLLHPSQMVCSISFDREDRHFATASVSRCIKIFDYAAMVTPCTHAKMHCPILEINSRSKLSSVCWNWYLRNQVAFSDYDGTVVLWDVAANTELMTFEEHSRRVWSVDISRSDPTRLVSGSDDGSVRVWSASCPNAVRCIDAHANVCSARFFPDDANLVAFSTANHSIQVYDLRNCSTPLLMIAAHSRPVSYVRMMSQSLLASASTDSTLKLWDLKLGDAQTAAAATCLNTYRGHANERNFVGLDVTPSGFLATGSETNTVHVYHKTFEVALAQYELKTLDPMTSSDAASNERHIVSSLCWASDGSTLLAGNSAGIVHALELC